MRQVIAVSALAGLLIVPLASALAADAGETATETKSAAVGVGDAAPKWNNLDGVDGKSHSLSDLTDAKAVAVVFTCNHCPVAKAYEDRLIEYAADYGDKGVEVVAINVNNMEDDKLPAMEERAAKKQFNFAYLYDPSQQIGRDFGATVTPHVFLLDGERNIAYIGAIDDSINPDKVTKQHLRDATDAILAGSKPQVDTTKPVGCGIKYE